MKTIEETIAIAKKELGNSGAKYWAYVFPKLKYINGNKTPYCACFASWLAKQAGISVDGFPNGWCPGITSIWKKLQVASKGGKYVKKAKNLKPGDFCTFDWQGDGTPDHIGYVIGNNGKHLTCLEGNTNGGIVAIRTRAYSTVAAGYRPTYAAKSSENSIKVKISGVKYKIVVDSLNVRSKRSSKSGKIRGQLKKGDFVYLTSVKRNRYGNYWGKISTGRYKGDFIAVKFNGNVYAKKA